MSTTIARLYNFVDDKNAGVPITSARMDGEFNQVITSLNQKVLIKATAPSSPVAGQLWLDSTTKLLKQYRNAEWVIMGICHVGTSAPTTGQEGDLWYDTTNDILQAYNGTTWGLHGVPVGTLFMWLTDLVPTGYLFCYGQSVATGDYSALYAVIGTRFGTGDTAGEFHIPDMRGRFPLGQDDMGGSSANRVTLAAADTIGTSGYGGAETHTISTAEMPAHAHGYTVTDVTANNAVAGKGTTGANVQSLDTGTSGSGTAMDIMNPYLTVNYIIKH